MLVPPSESISAAASAHVGTNLGWLTPATDPSTSLLLAVCEFHHPPSLSFLHLLKMSESPSENASVPWLTPATDPSTSVLVVVRFFYLYY
jgi:hypothetical protein